MAIGFQKESKWMFSASEDGMIKIWDIRAGTCQKDLSNGSPVNDAALHPNQVLGVVYRRMAIQR